MAEGITVTQFVSESVTGPATLLRGGEEARLVTLPGTGPVTVTVPGDLEFFSTSFNFNDRDTDDSNDDVAEYVIGPITESGPVTASRPGLAPTTIPGNGAVSLTLPAPPSNRVPALRSALLENVNLATLEAPQARPMTLFRTTAFKTLWSADVQLRIGREFDSGIGRFSSYASFGSTFMAAKVQGEFISARGGEMSIDRGFSSRRTLMGWKVSFGFDYDVSEHVQFFVQGDYADYGKESFGNLGDDLGDLSIRLNSFGGRAGFLFTF